MFAKLLKHEWKATAGMLGIFSLAAVGVGVIFTVLLRFVTVWSDRIPDMMWAPIVTMMGCAVLAICAYCIGSQVVLLARFYKNKFTDEGYLTFTLPVSCHQILLSSLLNYLIWTVITTVVTLAAIVLAVLIGTTKEGLLNLDSWETFFELLNVLLQEDGVAAYVVLYVLNMVVSTLSSAVLVHTAITLGAVLAKKHKILAAFGCYYGISMVVSILNSTLSFGYMIVEMTEPIWSESSIYWSMNMMMALQMLLYAGIGVGGYFLTHWLMKKKLNLP